jgi:hypothetical protein
MNNKDVINAVEKSGTKISKERILNALRQSPARDFSYATDPSSGLSIILIKLA